MLRFGYVFLFLALLRAQSYVTPPTFMFSKFGKWKTKALDALGIIRYSGRMRPGIIGPTRPVPDSIVKPHYAFGKNKLPKPFQYCEPVPISEDDLPKIRLAGRLAREVLDSAIRACKPGMTTDDIDAIVHEECIKRNSYPSPLNYQGFPKSVCTSINEVMCHGIPDSTVIQNGDTINIDVTVFHDGFHGDCSESIIVGDVSDDVKDLLKTTYTAWDEAIKACRPGMRYSDIAIIIEDIVKPKGYSIVDSFNGHGIGRCFHTHPFIGHTRASVTEPGCMEPGVVFTIEPIVCAGSSDYLQWGDKWTYATRDGKPSAQFEHTILITDSGKEILTKKLPDSPKYFWEK